MKEIPDKKKAWNYKSDFWFDKCEVSIENRD